MWPGLSHRRLERLSAVPLTRGEFRRLTGTDGTARGSAFLLRGFATNYSVTRVLVSGPNLLVESNALGGLFHLRRHPRVAWLERQPEQVYTVASYDM